MAIIVSSPTMINGRSADSFTNDELINLIADSQKEVNRLKGLNFESKTLSAMIKKEEKGIKDAIVVLDARDTEE